MNGTELAHIRAHAKSIPSREASVTTLHPVRLANAAAVSAAVLWAVCAAFVVLAPGPAMSVTGQMLHADLSAAEWSLSFWSFCAGLVAWTVLAWVLGAGIGWVYQMLTPAAPPVKADS